MIRALKTNEVKIKMSLKDGVAEIRTRVSGSRSLEDGPSYPTTPYTFTENENINLCFDSDSDHTSYSLFSPPFNN